MVKALIQGTRVVQIEQEEFPVAPSLLWIDCPDNVEPEWSYVDGVFNPPVFNSIIEG